MADTTESQSHTEVDLESLEKHDVPQDTIDDNDDLQKSERSQAPAAAAAPPEAPEGGTKAWLAVLGASAALFTSFGWTNCIGLFQDEYQSNQLKGYSSSTVSWITSVQCTLPLHFNMDGVHADEGSFLHVGHGSRRRQGIR
ncbi:hypothetical protein EIK77_007827 [Talaromyces pinophilus]|nr:hypothetical protein EIK77_007827 [Talaromyces pinophilus]